MTDSKTEKGVLTHQNLTLTQMRWLREIWHCLANEPQVATSSIQEQIIFLSKRNAYINFIT